MLSLQLLRIGRINAVIMPVLATLICILLVGYHLKDPTQDGQVCPRARDQIPWLDREAENFSLIVYIFIARPSVSCS